MQIASGDLSDLITFQKSVKTQSPTTGAWSTVWTDVEPQEWAEVLDHLPSRAETLDDNIAIARRPSRIRFRRRNDITSDMRVKFEGRVMEIIAGPALIARGAAMEIMCQSLSTQGNAP